MITPLPTAKEPTEFIGSALADLREFPADVRKEIGHAIRLAELGDKHPDAKPLKGFGGAGVLEIVERYDGDTYRVVYTVKFAGVIYVLHAFQKKSKKGIATAKADLDLIRSRFKDAKKHHETNYRQRAG